MAAASWPMPRLWASITAPAVPPPPPNTIHPSHTATGVGSAAGQSSDTTHSLPCSPNSSCLPLLALPRQIAWQAQDGSYDFSTAHQANSAVKWSDLKNWITDSFEVPESWNPVPPELKYRTIAYQQVRPARGGAGKGVQLQVTGGLGAVCAGKHTTQGPLVCPSTCSLSASCNLQLPQSPSPFHVASRPPNHAVLPVHGSRAYSMPSLTHLLILAIPC